ncbi:hypothetical protein P43SY_001815 [Pythium insidiosum]|uniref:VWFA domain-containing protein n=1 Tax=Pythium insidiosum TaxID=114742 RepID=A0AAD5LNL4_PYTIN|nr:hypothetical protein P43SY_001815 [Pythium insidiosum]
MADQASSSSQLHMASELVTLPDVLLEKLDKRRTTATEMVQQKTLYLSELEDTSNNRQVLDFFAEDANDEHESTRIGRDAPILLFDMREGAELVKQLVSLQLAPLREHELARQELAVVAKLLRVINMAQVVLPTQSSSSVSADSMMKLVRSIQAVLREMESMLDALIELGLRSPATYFPYQDIVWFGHAFLTADWSDDEVVSERVVAELRDFMDVAKSNLNGVLYGFHNFLRHNSFNDTERIALEVFDTQNKMRQRQRSKARKATVDGDLLEHTRVVPGWPRLLQSVGSAVMLRNIAEVAVNDSACATIETQVRLLRMEKLKEMLRRGDGTIRNADSEPLRSTVALLQELFITTVMAFESTIEPAVWQDVCETLRPQLVGESVMWTLQDQDRTELLRALRSSRDEAFVQLVDVLVAPLLQSINSAAASVKQSGASTFFAVGEGLVLLGLWRFLLLIPSSPVDPVTKPIIKKEMLMARVAMLALAQSADGAIERTTPRPIPLGYETHHTEVKALADEVRHVAAFALQRYNPEAPANRSSGTHSPPTPVSMSAFGDLFRDLLRFQKTIMPSEKLLGMLSVVRSGLTNQSKSRQVLRELEMFQGTTESFLAQLEKKFAGSFYDIVEPIAAAVSAVKDGISMLMSHIHHLQIQREIPRAEKEGLALSLLQFPHVADRRDEGDLEDVERLVRMVGSQAAGLVSSRPQAGRTSGNDIALLHVALNKLVARLSQNVATPSPNSLRVKDAVAVLSQSRSVFDLFLSKWQEQKDLEEQRRKEEEALFKYKTRTLDIESEDQLLEQEYRQQFPDFVSKDFHAFLTPEQQDAAAASLNGNEITSTADGGVWISDSLLDELCTFHLTIYASTPNAKAAPSHTKKSLIDAFVHCFSLAVNMRGTINALDSQRVERSAIASSLFAASLVQSRLTGRGNVPASSVLNSDYIRGIDFHRDPFVQEAVLVAQPLQDLLTKVQRLLALWPEHAILQQLVLIADRIRNFEIRSPLVRTLTAVELLVRKAQEWESYAAREYSIAAELSALSGLITRWRKLELYSWPHLLYVKERQHRTAAQKTWINMYSLLTGQFEGDIEELSMASTSKKELEWLHLNEWTRWLFDVQVAAKTTSTSLVKTEGEKDLKTWRRELFATLDAYIRTCPMGQFETRLLIVYAFCCQLSLERWSAGEEAHAPKQGLANVLYHLYRYYAQHMGFLDNQWSGLKAPIQRQLLEFVKICRWDEQTYYSLAESAEKSHRKLMKFIRDYDAVLTVNVQTVIDASSDSGITKEGGYSGITATRNELSKFGDGVVVPEIETTPVAEASEESEGSEVKPSESKKSVVADELDVDRDNAPIVLAHVNKSASPELINASLSSYAEKMMHLTKRISKFTMKQILSTESVTARQRSRETCEELCSTIFYRLQLFQHDSNSKDGPKLPKGAKKKALIDLLAELKAQGLSYHRAHLPAQQQEMEELFALDVPDVENCLNADGFDEAAAAPVQMTPKGKKPKKSKKNQRIDTIEKGSPLWLWQRADGYYYRFVNQLSSLRFSAMTQFSHDLSSSEVDRMNGYAENMLYRMLQHRQLLHAAAMGHEKLVFCLYRLRQMQAWRDAYMVNASNSQQCDVRVAADWQKHQQESVAQLRAPLRELEILVTQVLHSDGLAKDAATPKSPLTAVVAKEKFEQLYRLLDEISATFDLVDKESGRPLQVATGVPAIPFHSSLSSDTEERDGDAGLVSFAHPTRRVHGVSPTVAQEMEAPVTIMPVSPSTLLSNRLKFEQVHETLGGLQMAFSAIAPTESFDSLLSATSDIVASETAFEKQSTGAGPRKIAPTKAGDAEHSAKEFAAAYDKLVETILVAIQELTKPTQPSEDTASTNDDSSVSLRDQLTSVTTAMKNARIDSIATQLAALLNLVDKQFNAYIAPTSATTEWLEALTQSLSLLQTLEMAIVDVRGISRQLMADFLVAHKSVAKLDYVLIRIFRNLFQHGFCRSAEEQGDESGDGSGQKMKFEDDVEGTGMGEGEGKKDVSHEIEDEEQLLGLKGDEQQDQKPPENGEKPEDTGLEMQNDFDGTMQDVPEDENKDDDDRDDQDEEELDREMGEFDQDDENVVDEKKWGDDSDDDEDNIDKQNEKFEENSRMDGSEPIEDEIRGKDDEQDDAKKKKDEKPAAADEKDAPKDQSKEDDDDGDGDDDGEDDGEQNDPINDDFEDNYEEKHDNVDPNSRDGEEENEQQGGEDGGDDLPENMQLDGDDGDDGDDADGADVDDAMDEDPNDADSGDDADGEAADREDADEEAKEEEEETPDNSVQLGAGGFDEDAQPPEEEEDNAEPEKNEAEQENPNEQQKSSSTVAGTQSKDGADELEAEDEAMENDDDADASCDEKDDANEQNESKNTQSSRAQQETGDDDKQEWRPTTEADQQDEQPKRDRRKQEPNPYRNPQSAQEHWKRRIEMIKREKDASNDATDESDPAKESATAELLDDDEEMEDAQHALAPAQENQVMNQNQPTENEEKDERDDQPDGFGASAMEIEDNEDDPMDGSKEDEDEETDESTKESLPPASAEPDRDHEVDKDRAFEKKASEDERANESDNEVKDQKASDADIDMMDEDNERDGKMALPQAGETKRKENSTVDETEEDLDRPMPKLLSAEEVAALRDELDTSIANWSRNDQVARGAELWGKYTAITMGASQRLCEQLRLVLEPMLRAKLEGDFRTGKRINMRKVIPYIASQFRKDKIWMRRTRPSKRQYQIMVAIDDSESMADNHAGRLALEAMTTLCKAMSQLEVGELSIVKFGQDIQLLHAFDSPFTDDAGSRVITQFGFQQKKTNMITTLDAILQVLDTAKQNSSAASSSVEFTQIVFLISDGRFDTDGRTRIKKLIEKALEQQQLIVLLVVDQAENQANSILETKSVTFNKGKVEMVPYLENYPFPYYVILPTSVLLPEILSDSLRQWFEMLQMRS